MRFKFKEYFIVLFLVVVLFSGCQSNKNDLNHYFGVLVVDENDFSVPDFAVSIKSLEKKGKECIEKTDSQGLCMFQNFPKQTVRLIGTKNGYTKIDYNDFLEGRNQDVICFKVSSSEAVLSEVIQFYKNEEFSKGVELLNTLYFEKMTNEYFTVVFYKAIGYFLAGDNEKAQSEIEKMKGWEIYETKDYIRKIDELLGGDNG